MKINLLCLLFSLLPILAKAQNCKYEKNETDPFTKKKEIITKKDRLFTFTDGVSIGVGNNDTYSSILNAYIELSDSAKFLIFDLEGNLKYFMYLSDVFLLLSDGTVCKFHDFKKQTLTGNSSNGQTNTIYRIYCTVSIDQQKLLKNNTISQVPIHGYQNASMEKEIKDKNSDVIKNLIKCA